MQALESLNDSQVISPFITYTQYFFFTDRYKKFVIFFRAARDDLHNIIVECSVFIYFFSGRLFILNSQRHVTVYVSNFGLVITKQIKFRCTVSDFNFFTYDRMYLYHSRFSFFITGKFNIVIIDFVGTEQGVPYESSLDIVIILISLFHSVCCTLSPLTHRFTYVPHEVIKIVVLFYFTFKCLIILFVIGNRNYYT